ncbi:hypothetical protein KIPB_006264 [Kipferlia bialata]|uniref:Uncharacterized protein n=1 Tax=Kipferlia bialata TaxID=797122 RepID=A0A9K3GJP9_9EUKA|nr:hypothetical protein KIPB_006264 [Kipferlia bialata]|eukprot:g6264.t1
MCIFPGTTTPPSAPICVTPPTMAEEVSEEEVLEFVPCVVSVVDFVNHYIALGMLVYTRGPFPLGTLSPAQCVMVEDCLTRGRSVLATYPTATEQAHLAFASINLGLVDAGSWIEFMTLCDETPVDMSHLSEAEAEAEWRRCLAPFSEIIRGILQRNSTSLFSCNASDHNAPAVISTLRPVTRDTENSRI